jgi:hypothetical protein
MAPDADPVEDEDVLCDCGSVDPNHDCPLD